MMAGEDKAQLCVLGFITLWIILTAGTPDLIDALVKRVGQYDYSQESGK